ncbi:bifunctional diguanylate cyclase/phosphodiesterase [Bacillus sp. REN16]|uniref:sensor domain-containing diguanylate cyclase n=1 Tax=Bacillus sp. REN16 TaxID=2887296 RepID=UPI001E5E56C7|nr:diguanylate cyclase [Bacillus sp. REN16]MCC3357028.1 diguanylate cyclase [Bacillus sp. REN16]
MLFSTEGSYTTEYHLWMVILSILIGIFTSYVALHLINRNKKSTKSDKFWLISASLVMGGGVWAVHFIGMLAVHINVTVTYNIWLVFASLCLIVIFSILAFSLITNSQKNKTVAISSLLMGLGIFSMHYLSMRSMQMEANLTYAALLLLLSLLAAIVGAWVTFWLFSKYREATWFGFVGSIIFGSGIASMHYIGMSATIFEKVDLHQHGENLGGYVLSGYTIATAITIFIITLLGLLLFQASRDEKLQIRLIVSQEHYKRLVELAPVGIIIHKFGIVQYINPTGIEILGGKNTGQFVGMHFLNLIHPDYHQIIKNRWKTMRNDKPVEAIEEVMIRVNKQPIHAEVSAFPYEMDEETYVQVFFTNITERKEAEKMMYQLAFYDGLSGLPNRRYFTQELDKAIDMGQPLSVLFLDLDGFKVVNDTYGHDVGDTLIQHISSRLKELVSEKGVLSRMAGDEFNIFLPDTTLEETTRLAETIIQSVQQEVIIGDVTVFVTSSIGIAFFPEHGEKGGTLMKHADMAMFEAKRDGKNKYHFY